MTTPRPGIRAHLLLLTLVCVPGHAQLSNDPDSIETDDGPLTVHPVLHGSLILEWSGVDVYMDPYGDASLYAGKSDPDLILITHAHDDHFNLETLNSLNTQNAQFIVPQVVADAMPEPYRAQAMVLGNGETLRVSGITIRAMPMYNLPEDGARHAKGVGNGYVLTMGGKDVYVSGDTEGIPEMRELTGIDVAFVCMNLPYTMDVEQAAGAVMDFRPAIVYPYHHRGQDIEAFRELVNAGGNDVEVRLKDWYPGQ